MNSNIGRWLIASWLVAGCYLPEEGGENDSGMSALPNDSGMMPGDAGPTQSAADVPCEVSKVLAARCFGCHGDRLAAPMKLVSLANLKAPSISNPQVTVAQQSVRRLRDSQRPMPPSGPLSEQEIQTVEQWVTSGAGAGMGCGQSQVKPDGGHSSFDAGMEVFDGGTGLPCNVEQLLARECRQCHGSRPIGPMSLLTRRHFQAPSPSSPNLSVGARSVQRMQDATSPMPPSGMLSAADRAVLADWVAAGMPEDRCGTVPDAGPDLFNVPAQCSSGLHFTPATECENAECGHMNPGRACLTCHDMENARRGRERAPGGAAGTVYPTAHEPDYCLGVNMANTSVIITGANGASVTLPVNSSGNFYAFSFALQPLTAPYRVRVRSGGRERVMATPQMRLNCNSCHTQNGANGAPGRIVAP